MKGVSLFYKKILLIVVVFFALFSLLSVAVLKISYPIGFEDYVNKYSSEFELEPELVFAVINAESGFNALSKSNKGALGLMQIMPSTAEFIANELQTEKFEEGMLLNPEVNIRFGCFYLSYLYNKFEDTDMVLFAYNAGEGTLVNYLKEVDGEFDFQSIEIGETKHYIERVLKSYNHYKKWHKT